MTEYGQCHICDEIYPYEELYVYDTVPIEDGPLAGLTEEILICKNCKEKEEQ